MLIAITVTDIKLVTGTVRGLPMILAAINELIHLGAQTAMPKFSPVFAGLLDLGSKSLKFQRIKQQWCLGFLFVHGYRLVVIVVAGKTSTKDIKVFPFASTPNVKRTLTTSSRLTSSLLQKLCTKD